MMSYLTVESLNCRGLRDLKKRIDIFDDFKKRNVNIVHLQETHLIAADLPSLKKLWNCKFLISGDKKQSLGVVTIINNNFEYKLHMVNKDRDGRFILCDLELPGIARFLMLNIYGHNQDKPELLSNILNMLEENMIRNWILCGDWNLVLDQNLDTLNYLESNNPNSTLLLKQFIQKYNLLDIWRQNNPEKRKFTWFRSNPTKAARLDFFLISQSILDIFSDSYIRFKYRSDHCKIGIKLHLEKTIKGKGIWKLNADLLNDNDLMEKINEGILLMVEIHACTPYSPDHVKHFDKFEITFMTDIDVFWEVLLTHLRGIFITYAARKKRVRLNRETSLTKEIEKLEDLFILDITDRGIEDELNNKKKELEVLRDIRLEGAFVRARIKDHILGEKPNKHFLNLENSNFISKNIKELVLEEGDRITKPKDILDEMRRFYQSLYNYKQTQGIEDSNLFEYTSSFETLNDTEKDSLDDCITEEELRGVVFNSGTNKSPGPGGYTNEFYKSLWTSLKILLLNLMNYFFNNKYISQNHLMGIITCIPKGDKIRNKLKNWRPITLLNSIYKFYSGIWANRIKAFLPKLIGNSQTGFVQNRFIGENTRLTLDILNESKTENTSGLLILVDFEKAFDSISWDFISKILKLFNFSDQTIQVVKSLQKNSVSKILQNGHQSDIINLQRGCRQGDPISPYIFVLAVELLGVSVRVHKELIGYKIRDVEHRISQFADDTTLFILNSERNLRLCMNILEDFHRISGLKINVDKTKVVKFGGDRDSSDNLCPDLNLIWTNNFTSLGINYDVTDLENITQLNIEPKLLDMERLIRIWQLRNLTLIGKIIIIKSLLVSKFIHILLSLPSPNECLFVKIESIFEKFLWNGGPPKFRKQILEHTVAEGALQYPNIRKIDATMKISWFKRIYKSKEGWASIPHMYNMGNIYVFGDMYQKKLIREIPNIFWNDTVKALMRLTDQNVYHSKESLLTMPLWYNSKIIPWKNKFWINKGIVTIGDILDDNGNMLDRNQIQTRWNVICDFLLHSNLKRKINIICQQAFPDRIKIFPQMSHILYDIEIGNKGNKNVYFNILGKDSTILHTLSNKWSETLNDNINIELLAISFKNSKRNSPSVYQYFNQFKLLHNRSINNILLKKMNLIDSDKCLFCDECVETIKPIYLECRNTIALWADTITWVRRIYDNHFIISDHEKIFGEPSNNQISNIIIISVKDVIYQKRKTGSKMTVLDVKRCLLKNLSVLKSRDVMIGKLQQFENNWNLFIMDLRNDINLRNSWYRV